MMPWLHEVTQPALIITGELMVDATRGSTG